jgi:hypothetical protein
VCFLFGLWDQYEELTRKNEELQHKVDEADSILAKTKAAAEAALKEVQEALEETRVYVPICSSLPIGDPVIRPSSFLHLVLNQTIRNRDQGT